MRHSTEQLVEERTVISYLQRLRSLYVCICSTKKTVRYAVCSMSEVLEHLQQNSVQNSQSSLQSNISDTRTWLCQLQAATTIDTFWNVRLGYCPEVIKCYVRKNPADSKM